MELILQFLTDNRLLISSVASILVFCLLAARRQLANHTNRTVAAVYRVAIRAAAHMGDEGIAWLRSENGILARQQIAAQAYDLLPARLGPVPIGVVKLVVTREQFIRAVEAAFEEMVALADRLEATA